MKMISMKNDKKDKEPKLSTAVDSPCCNEEDYPYGLRITLNDESLKKLGISDAVDEYDTDNEVTITAKCKVKRVEKSKSKDSYGEDKERENQCLELQITELCLDDAESGEEDDELSWDEEDRGKADRKLKNRGYE